MSICGLNNFSVEVRKELDDPHIHFQRMNMWKYSESHHLCNKFDFEVPLEDLCPSNYLHPKILIMYNQALKSFHINNISLDALLSSRNEGPEYKIKVKESLLEYKHSKLNGTPQSFVWLIEHFLGLLPIPLLAPYVNGCFLNWLSLSHQCRGIFQDKNYRKSTNNFNLCDHQISTEIAKLPPQHKLLLNMHMEFIRKISFLNVKKRRSLIYYCKYFTPSLLMRPFRSGLNDNSEKEYYFLVLYIALRWPSINEAPEDSILSTIREITESESSMVDKVENRKISKKLLKRGYCCSLKTNTVIASSFDSIQHVAHKPSVEEGFTTLSISSLTVVNSDEQSAEGIKTVEKADTIHNSSEKRLKTGSNLESLEANINNEPEICSVKTEQQNHIVEQVKKSRSLKNLHKIVTRSEEIFGKDHTILDKSPNNNSLLNRKKNTNIPPVDNESSPPIISNTNPESIKIDTNILKRISKVGWTYTPPRETEKQPNGINLIKDILDDETTEQELIKGSQSETTLKKYPSVKSLRSRLSFLKIRRKKTDNHKLSTTNLKYTKINS